MMTSVSGELGIGKTYHLSKQLYDNYRQGCLCISNYKHVYAHIQVRNKPELLIDIIREVGKFKRRGYELCDLLPTFIHGGVFIGIDEGHLTFGTDYKDREDLQFILEFLSLARKQDVDIWYVVQDPAKIHKNFRRYTNSWIRYRAVVPIFKKILVPHPTRPTFRREKRLIVPFVWEEDHRLDYENPVFNYARSTIDGVTEWSKTSTLNSRRIRRTKDKFIFKLYDSHEMVGMRLPDAEEGDYNLLKGVSYIPHTMRKERLPTFKKLLGMKCRDSQAPLRTRFNNIYLPEGVQHDISESTVIQPEQFLDDITCFNQLRVKGKKYILVKNVLDTPKKATKRKVKRKVVRGKKKGENKGLFDFLVNYDK